MQINLREVTQKDWDFILNLRNQFYVNSFYEQKKPIQKEEHYEYMKKQNCNPNFYQWIATYGNNDVGYIRILDEDINIMVKKKFQGMGIGTVMLNLVENKALSLGIKKLKAIVLVGNENSKKIFIKNNYKLKMYLFEKELVN